MKKVYRGFTLLEVMIAIFVFSTGMMAFMSYHARANTMVFETESAQIAHAIGTNLAQEVSSMTPERFRLLCDTSGIAYGTYVQEGYISNYFDQGGEFEKGPFNAWGEPVSSASTDEYMFYRFFLIDTYQGMTDIAAPATSQLARLRHFEIFVSWPLKGHGSVKCNAVGKSECNYLRIPIIKGVAIEP